MITDSYITPLSPLPSNIVNLFTDGAQSVKSAPDTGDSFAGVLAEAFKTAEAADSADKYSGIELLSGQSDDMSGLLLDAQKAEISLNLALQIRNKVVEAYNDIIKMQV
ncbi:MAG: flagellar hook-basal body complex protein FliE [Oscillospiraceae bacterium]|jgi:flagellar hook-basal body complex protein FliE|nr:flagellar hook-basal body complex protein FliE [Oscillospiraceae bacterium]